MGTAGVTTRTLADVSLTSGGTLKKRAFDAQGRLSQEASATTDDLAEGSNLYFTNARVLATTLTGLSTGTSTPVVATDSILVGIGKLQAQVNTNATAIAGKEPAIASGTTAQYWRGDKSWRDFATDVRAAVLTGLSTATSAVITATDTALGALGKLQAQITDNLLPQGYIDGLKMVWVSGTALTVTTGAAYIPSLGKVLRVTSDIPKTGLSLTASTWYHVYLYNNAGTPDIEIVTTAPAAAYNGTARSKTGDSSRRYVGSVKTDSGGGMLRFSHNGDRIFYMANPATAPFRLLSAGTATTPTSIDLSVLLPTTSEFGMFKLTNFASNVTVVVDTPESSSLFNTIANSGLFVDCAVPSRSVSYYYPGTPSGGGAYFDVRGYVFAR